MFKKKRSKSQVILSQQEKRKQAMQQETVEERLAKIPISEDVEFLEAIKTELGALKKRLRHEVLHKFQLLK